MLVIWIFLAFFAFFKISFNLENHLRREGESEAAEERPQNEPRTADYYEKLLRSSPNNGKFWTDYVDFMCKSADVEKARTIAERYSLEKLMLTSSLLCMYWISIFTFEAGKKFLALIGNTVVQLENKVMVKMNCRILLFFICEIDLNLNCFFGFVGL